MTLHSFVELLSTKGLHIDSMRGNLKWFPHLFFLYCKFVRVMISLLVGKNKP